MLSDETSRPACFASAVMPAGVMSGVPTMCSCARVSCTVPRAFQPIERAPIPNAMRTTAAMNPPYSKILRMMCSLRVGGLSGPSLGRRGSGGLGGRAQAVAGIPPIGVRVFPRPVRLIREGPEGVQDHRDVDRLLGEGAGDGREQ